MFILSSISSGSEFLSVNHTSTYENSELKVCRNIQFFGKTSSIRKYLVFLYDLFGTNVYKTLKSCW